MKLHAPAARAIREKSGLTVSKTAEQLGVTQGQVSNWEAGRRQPTELNLYALAGLLGVPLAAITIPDATKAVA
jgi:transcriptional regulator with XRE-family HTH domain